MNNRVMRWGRLMMVGAVALVPIALVPIAVTAEPAVQKDATARACVGEACEAPNFRDVGGNLFETVTPGASVERVPDGYQCSTCRPIQAEILEDRGPEATPGGSYFPARRAE